MLCQNIMGLIASPLRINACTGQASTGQLCGFVLQLLCQNIMGLISSPLRIIVAMAMLYVELGPASIVAFGVLVLLMPTQARAPALSVVQLC
jgi:hypothetical protein